MASWTSPLDGLNGEDLSLVILARAARDPPLGRGGRMIAEELPRPYYEDEVCTIYHGESQAILPMLSGTDLVVTDPPYAFGLASTFTEGKSGSWGDLMNNSLFYTGVLSEAKRLTANRRGAAWIFNSWRSLPTLMRAAYEARWGIESLLVWDKQWIGPGGHRGLRPSYELVALFCHPEFQLKDRGLPDIWPFQWTAVKPSGHPAEKPVALLTKIIRESGATHVIDPFMGSGSTLVAAKNLGVRAVGIEVEERYCAMAAERLAQEALPLGLPLGN